ncbi:hypothetical protein P7C73_g497, partial [Tremellales sp. Uapishka_1]
MSPEAHLQTLIAHYLALHYPTVVEPFIQAAHLPRPDLTNPPTPDLRTVVSDHLSQELASRLGDVTMQEDRINNGDWRGWDVREMVKVEMGEQVRLSGLHRTLDGVSASNLLAVQVVDVAKRVFDLTTASYHSSVSKSIVVTSVDKTLKIIDYVSGEVDRIVQPHRAAILCFAFHPNPRYLLTGSMDGTAIITDLITSTPVQTFSSTKFVVRTAFSPDGQYMATASYDRTVAIYSAVATASTPDPDALPLDETDDERFASDPTLRYTETKRIKVDSNPESILFHPSSTYLLYTLRSSYLLYYVNLRTLETTTKSFNPHPMDTHLSFSVLNMALHPSGRIVACQTGDHRGGSGERILLYGVEPEEKDWHASGQATKVMTLCSHGWPGSPTEVASCNVSHALPISSLISRRTSTPTGHLKLLTLEGEIRSDLKVHGVSDLGVASSEVIRDCCVVRTGSDEGWEVVSVGYDKKVRISR